MTPEEFVTCVAREKEELLATYFDPESGSAVAAQIEALRLCGEQTEALRLILDGALTDALYTLLLGLDGAGSIGGVQSDYDLRAEDGTPLAGGVLEAVAWERFHGTARE